MLFVGPTRSALHAALHSLAIVAGVHAQSPYDAGRVLEFSAMLGFPALLLVLAVYWLHRRFQQNLFPREQLTDSTPIPLANFQEIVSRLKLQEEEITRLRREAEQQDNDTLQLSRQVLSHLPSGVIFFDRWGRVQDANPAARTALGYASPRGLLPVDLFRDAVMQEEDGSPLGRASDLIREGLVSDRSLQRKNMDYRTPTGERRLLGVTFFPLRAEGQISGLICLLTDLTAIRALESELERRRSLSALGEMSAGIAHEFKNSLATISGYAQMLYRSLPADAASSRQHVTRILDQVQNLTTVATEFLTFARPLDVVTSDVNLNRLLRECVEHVRMQDFDGIALVIEDDFPDILGDPVLLSNVFMNLLRNSCQAIAEQGHGGVVQVRLESLEEWQVQISVRDTGPGIPEELRNKIFIPFFTTKTNGTGLGLAMAHKIVTAHQGSMLLADSSPGSVAFVVTLPLDLPLSTPSEVADGFARERGATRLTPPTVPI